MMTTDAAPGEAPVSLNEARGWLRLGPTVDDAVVAQLVRAATNLCEAFIGQRLIIRAAEEFLPLRRGRVRLAARPVVAIDAVTLVRRDGGEAPLAPGDYRTESAGDGSLCLTPHDPGDAAALRVAYRAGLATGANDVPEAIRQGIIRMTQHLHDARDGEGGAPPAAIAALWQPWRRMTLGGGR